MNSDEPQPVGVHESSEAERQAKLAALREAAEGMFQRMKAQGQTENGLRTPQPMTPAQLDEAAIEALAVALNDEFWGRPWNEAGGYEHEIDRKSAWAIWQRIDRQALRRALLADVREGVEGLPFCQGAMPSTGDYFDLSLYVERAAVLALLGGDDAG